MRSRRRRSGFTILCVLMALVIIGILGGQYMAPVVPGGKTYQQTVTDRARSAATLANLRSLQTNVAMAEIDGKLTPERMREMVLRFPAPADGGRYFIDLNGQVNVTTAIPYKTFAERAGVPSIR